MGKDFKREATAVEIAAMGKLLAADMAAGSIGLSTGLEYDPGIYSSHAEVIALAGEVAAQGGRYISHIRSEDRDQWAAIDELIEIGRVTHMPVQLSHIKIGLVDAWGQAHRFIAKLDAARKQGIEVSADIYPYEYWQSTLTVMFPERNFTDRAAADYALKSLAPPEGLRLSTFRPDPSLVGKTVAEVAAMRGKDASTTLMELIAEAPEPFADESVIGTSMAARDVAALMKWDQTNICSDGQMTDRHPRGAGSFARILRKYVREDKLLTLEQAIHKMSGLAAAHMGIADRGVIRPGTHADLVLFDPATIADRATIESPSALAVGVDRVWVNGSLIYANGRATGARPG
ncbi:MAG: N-acyl-D-amino-acid deacylase family protein, partial [Burkholderiales bacterium]